VPNCLSIAIGSGATFSKLTKIFRKIFFRSLDLPEFGNLRIVLEQFFQVSRCVVVCYKA